MSEFQRTREKLLYIIKNYLLSAGIITEDGSIVTIPASGSAGAPTDAQYITLATDGDLTSERVLTAGTGISITDGGAGSTVTISVSGSAGAPTDAQYVTLATDGDLANERVLTAGTGISITDGGAGSTVTISASGSAGAPTDAQYITLATDGTLTNERVLTAGTGISITDGGAGGNVTISSTTTSSDKFTIFCGPEAIKSTAGTLAIGYTPWRISDVYSGYTNLRITGTFRRSTAASISSVNIAFYNMRTAATDYTASFVPTGTNYETLTATTSTGSLSATDTNYRVELRRNGTSGAVTLEGLVINLE